MAEPQTGWTFVAPWLAIAISVAGWMVTYRLSVKSQKKQFLNTLLNDARKDVVRAIRREQEALILLGAALHGVILHSQRIAFPWTDWESDAKAVDEARRATTADVSMVIEEYEQLFPFLVTCKGELAQLRTSLWAKTGDVALGLPNDAKRTGALQTLLEVIEQQKELTFLLEDLRVVVQNETFGLITETRAPLRQVKGDRARLGWDANTDKLRVILPAEGNQQ